MQTNQPKSVIAAAAPQPQAATPLGNLVLRWTRIWHTLTYLALGIGTADALLLNTRPVQEYVFIVALTLLFGAWYALCIIVDYDRWQRHPLMLAGYLGVTWAVWLALTLFEMIYMVVLVGLYAQIFILLNRQGKVASAAILAVIAIARQTIAAGEISVVFIAIMLLSTVVGILQALFTNAIIGQNYERQRLIEELKATREELAASERQAGILAERQRLAREIHDTLAQGFTSIIMNLEALDAALPLEAPAARRLLEQARHMVMALQPEPLEQASLGEALQRLVERWSEESDVAAHLTITGDTRPLAPPLDVTLLRAAQETLMNVRKHARASTVTLTLSYMDDLVALDEQDNGVGFDPAQAPCHARERSGGFGLRVMRERVESLDGTFSLESAPGEGTTVAVALPLLSVPAQQENG